MRILWLGNSNDLPSAEVAEGQLRHKLLEPRLAEALGEDVVIQARQLWPTPDAARVVERWMGGFEPEVVYLKTNSFWFNHQSVPLRLERLLGPLGRPVSRSALAANDAGWLAHNAAFRRVRDFCRKRIDGAYHYEPEEVVQRMGECIRVILRSEGVTLVVASSFGKRDWALTEQSRQRAEERRLRVHRGLERLCAELHVDYLGRALPRYREFGPEDTRLLGRDAFHRNAEGHRDNVDEKFQILLPICRKAQEGRDARASEGVTKGGFESEKVAKNSHSW